MGTRGGLVEVADKRVPHECNGDGEASLHAACESKTSLFIRPPEIYSAEMAVKPLD